MLDRIDNELDELITSGENPESIEVSSEIYEELYQSADLQLEKMGNALYVNQINSLFYRRLPVEKKIGTSADYLKVIVI